MPDVASWPAFMYVVQSDILRRIADMKREIAFMQALAIRIPVNAVHYTGIALGLEHGLAILVKMSTSLGNEKN